MLSECLAHTSLNSLSSVSAALLVASRGTNPPSLPGSAIRLARLIGPVGSIDLPSAYSGGGGGKCSRDACDESGPRPNSRPHATY